MNKTKIKKVLKNSAILIGSILLALILIASGFIYWVLYHPASAWNFASRYFLPSDLKVTWESIDYNWTAQAWDQYNFSWKTKNFSIVKGDPSVDVGITSAEIAWSLNLWNDKPIFDFETLNVETRKDSFVQLVTSTKPSPEESIYQTVTDILSYMSQTNKLAAINVVNLKFNAFQLRLPDGEPWTITAHLSKKLELAHDQQIILTAEVQSGPLFIKGDGWVNAARFSSADHFLELNINVVDTNWSVQSKVNGVFKDEKLSIQGNPLIEVGDKKKIRISPAIKVVLQPSVIDIDAQMEIVRIPGPIVKLSNIKAEAHIPLEDNVMWTDTPATFKATTPIDLFLMDKNMRPPLEKACRCKLPEEFVVRTSGQVWFNKLFGNAPSRERVAQVRAELDSVSNKLFSADIAANVEVFRQSGTWSFAPTANATIVVHSFQGLRQFLDAKGVIIPAPLDVLDGEIRVVANSPIDRDDKHITTTISVATDLKSERQKALLDATVDLELSNDFKVLDVDAEIVAQKLILELPPLDPVLGVPAVTRDSRILKLPPVKTTRGQFIVRVFTRMHTATDGAIQLLSKFAKPYVPVSVAVNLKRTDTSGFIRLEPFTVSYLRRDIHVETLKVDITKDEDAAFPLNGKFRIEQGGYIIHLTLKGTTEAPSIAFSSEPTLSKDDIISVLLYGRVSDQLVSAEAETAGNFNAAVADRAIGIVGLWAFASTPIQSFSYNSTTKVYTATVDLGNGLTAGVGTNWERATNFELRKRLSRRWALTASFSPSQTTRQEGRLVLQWEKRF